MNRSLNTARREFLTGAAKATAAVSLATVLPARVL